MARRRRNHSYSGNMCAVLLRASVSVLLLAAAIFAPVAAASDRPMRLRRGAAVDQSSGNGGEVLVVEADLVDLRGYSLNGREDEEKRELGDKKKKRKDKNGSSKSKNKSSKDKKNKKANNNNRNNDAKKNKKKKKKKKKKNSSKKKNTKKRQRSSRDGSGSGSKSDKSALARAQELMDEENAVFLAAFANNRGEGMSMPPTPRPIPAPTASVRPPPITPAPTPRPPTVPPPTAPPPTASAPTPLPPTTPAPTNSCNLPPFQRRVQITDELSKVSDPLDFFNPNSPRRRALDFIVDDDLLQLCPDDPNLVQRYIAVVFYYSTDGPNWSECSEPNDINDPDDVEEANEACNIRGDGSQFAGSDAWLTGVSECQWGGITCEDSGEGSIRSVFFENINLGGTLPFELQDLEQLLALHVEEGRTSGTIPEEFGNIKSLEELDLNFNQITGTIPESLYQLANLVELDLNDNQLEGTISPDVGKMPNLQFFQLQNNLMEGTVPNEMGRLARLVIFNIDENRFTGSMPQEVCDRRDINGGSLASLTADCLDSEDTFYIQCDTPDCCTMCF